MLAALKWLEDHAPEGTLNAQAHSLAYFPEQDPHWDSNDSQEYQRLEWYQEALLGGMKEGGRKAMKIRKHQRSSKGQMRVLASSMSTCVRPSTLHPL
jgi:hypothetical protein